MADEPTCFDCVFYAEPLCRIFNEVVESEIFAARDCEEITLCAP